MQGALDMGQSLVVDADIGVGASTRNAFMAAFETVKKTLQPTPLCLLVVGTATNRSGGGSDPLLGVRGNLVNMADAPLKVKLEAASDDAIKLLRSRLLRLDFDTLFCSADFREMFRTSP